MKAPLDLKDRRLIICLGPGGVGKTTISSRSRSTVRWRVAQSM